MAETTNGNVAVPEKAKVEVQARMAGIQAAQNALNSYLHGLMQGMGLDGDYNLNTQSWQLVPMKPSDKQPEGNE